MNTLSYRPNLLFLIWIRNKHALFILNHKLNRKLYYQKLIIALTTNETGNGLYGACKIWKVNGKKHKDDGPASIYGISKNNPNGTYHYYYQHGILHRRLSQDGKVGPAIINGISTENPNGTNHFYYKHGQRHRDNGPACIEEISKENPNGTRHYYYMHGELVDRF